MKPIDLLFLNTDRKQANHWAEHLRRQGVIQDIHFIQKQEEAEDWKESITIDGRCAGVYDLKLFLSNCRRDAVKEGGMVELVESPPFFSLSEHFERKDGEGEYKDGYREVGIVYRCLGASHRHCYYPQSPQALSDQRPALFLDRDGVINVDKGYVYRKEDIELCPGIGELVETAKKKGWWVCVLSNQSGVGRGFYSREQVELLHQFMGEELAVDRWFFCPYHPEGKGTYRGISHCRKPGPGMVLKAEQALPIDRLKSLMVGDKESDRIRLQGLESVLIQGNYDLNHENGEVFSRLDEIRKRL